MSEQKRKKKEDPENLDKDRRESVGKINNFQMMIFGVRCSVQPQRTL